MLSNSKLRVISSVLVILSMAIPGQATAADRKVADAAADSSRGEIMVQLNKLVQAGDACRMAYVFRNGLDRTIGDLGIEVVVFDAAGQVIKLLAIAPGRLIAGKTRVKQYDVKGLNCKTVGRLLINDVSRCKGEGLDAQSCLDRLRPSTRIDVKLIN